MVNVRVEPTSISGPNVEYHVVINTNDDVVDSASIGRAIKRALEPSMGEEDVKANDETQRDFVDFQEVEPLLLDVVALLKIMHKLDVAMDGGEGVKLSFRQARVLHRAISHATPLNDLEANLQTMYQSLTGTYFDHEKYGQDNMKVKEPSW